MADERKRRSAVSELLRQFFASLTTQLSSSTAEIWSKVEQRLSNKPSAAHPEGGEASRKEMQAQATQQQQHRKTDDS